MRPSDRDISSQDKPDLDKETLDNCLCEPTLDSTAKPLDQAGAALSEEEHSLGANEWPHLKVNVPHVAGSKRDAPLCDDVKKHADNFLGRMLDRIAADIEEPPVRLALGLVLAAVVIAVAAILAPIALVKAVLVAIAGLTGAVLRLPVSPFPVPCSTSTERVHFVLQRHASSSSALDSLKVRFRD